MPISSGILAPGFTLRDENGLNHSLADYRGKPLILYFYPKDDTPGCTTEACNFRDDYSNYQEAQVVILGISPDTSRLHKKFKTKYDLPFTLLADEDHSVCDLYGVRGPKKYMGKSYEGVNRTTFLIDSEGVIRMVFENVKPAEHSAEVIETLRQVL